MALEFRCQTVHLVCDTCGRGERTGKGTTKEPYRYDDAPQALYRTTIKGKTYWICEECMWELERKEFTCN